MSTVFVLQHEYEWCGRDEIKMIGVYATEAEAQAAVERLRDQPGFRDWPDGIAIDEYALGKDHWVEGFVTIVSVLIPPEQGDGEYQICHAVWRPGDLYKLGVIDVPENSRFSQDDVVRVEERSVPGHGERALVVVERMGDEV